MSKEASQQAAWALLTEGVSSARVEAYRLSQMVARALSLVGDSEYQEHLYEIAGDLIVGLPKRIQDLERHLDRTSYALTKIGDDLFRSNLPLEDRFQVENATHPQKPDALSPPKRATFRVPVQDLAGVKTFVYEGLPHEPESVLPVPEHTDREQKIDQYYTNKPDHIEPRTRNTPGEEYGHPWKYDVLPTRRILKGKEEEEDWEGEESSFVQGKRQRERKPAEKRKEKQRMRQKPQLKKKKEKQTKKWRKKNPSKVKRYQKKYRKTPQKFKRFKRSDEKLLREIVHQARLSLDPPIGRVVGYHIIED